MEFGMSRRIKPKEKYVHISMKEILRNLELWSYVVSFEFGRPKSSSVLTQDGFLKSQWAEVRSLPPPPLFLSL